MHYIKLIIKNDFTYRWSVFFSTLSSVIGIAVLLLLWMFLYKNDTVMVNYMVKYTILANIFSLFYCRNMAAKIGDKVSSGDFILDLIKPVNIFGMAWQMELAGIITQLVLRGIPVVTVYLYFLIQDRIYHNIFLCVISIIFSHILFVLMYSWLGFLAYIFINIWPFQRLLEDSIRLLGGGVIPLALLGNRLLWIANVLPFRFLYAFPLGIIIGNISNLEIIKGFLVEMIWIVILVTLNIITYKKAVKKAVVQGG